MAQRKITVHAVAPAADRSEIAKILAYYITGGDAAGYLARIAEKQSRAAAGRREADEAQSDENQLV